MKGFGTLMGCILMYVYAATKEGVMNNEQRFHEDRDMTNFVRPFPEQPIPDGWEELHRRSIAAKDNSLLDDDNYVEAELIFSLPVMDYADRNTKGKGLSHGR